MTKEQEAIEILNKFKNNEMQRDKLEISRYGGWKIGDIYKHLELNPAMETVLNMLKGKDKEIDKKNEIIDELVKYIDSNNYVDNEECQFQWDFKIEKCAGNGDCKDCIKQYFERKNEE